MSSEYSADFEQGVRWVRFGSSQVARWDMQATRDRGLVDIVGTDESGFARPFTLHLSEHDAHHGIERASGYAVRGGR